MEEGLSTPFQTDSRDVEVAPDSSTKWKVGGVVLGLSLIGVAGVSQMNSQSKGRLAVELDEQPKSVPSGTDLKSLSTDVSQPNVFMFTVDDMGWNDMGYNSGDLSEATPYMKSLAKKGVTLTHYYSQPSCTPSRVSMMTGKYTFRNGFQNYELQYDDTIGVPLSNKLLPAHMKEAGYKTIGFGKWNIGHCNQKYLPNERGFDHYLGYLCPGHGYTDFDCGHSAGLHDMIEGWASTNDDGTTDYTWATGYQYLGTYDTLLYRDQSVNAINKHFKSSATSSVPLFMWLAHHGIHSEQDSDPIPPSDLLTSENMDYLKVLRKRLDENGSEEDDFFRFFKLRMITATVLMSLDNCLRTLVETLEGLGQLSNSVIFVNSDNGGDTYYNKGHPGNNYPLRSEKFAYFEGGIRVPAFVFAPGFIPTSREGTTYNGLMHHVDLLATFLHLAGVDTDVFLADNDEYDSLDQWDAIIGDSTSPRTEIVFNMPRSKTWTRNETATSQGVAFRMGNYKMLINHYDDGWFSPRKAGGDFKTWEDMYSITCNYDFYTTSSKSECVYGNYLFNIIDDPNEYTNLWDEEDYKKVKKVMIARFTEILTEEPNDYGKIIPEYYERGANGDDSGATVFLANNDFIVPWDCDTIA